MKKLTLCSLFFCIAQSTPALANDYLTSNSFSDDMNAINEEASMKMSDMDQALAKQWMLDETDWVKYKTIMSGPRGIWSPGLDPLTALGVSETDPQERRRYAELWIKMETRRVELELAFEVERMKAGKRLNGDLLAVNNQAWITQWEADQKAVTHQVLYFVDASCMEDCKPQFDNLFKSIGNNAKLDIYFSDGIGSEEIGIWAANMGIDPAVVRSKKVTLNFDGGISQSMNIKPEEFPAVRVVDVKSGEVTDAYEY